MLPIDTIVIFIFVAIGLAMVPGPDNIFVMTQSALYGRKAGFYITLGLASGIIIHTSTVAFGVVTLLQTSQYAYTLIKWVGAAYLLYLAWQALSAQPMDLNTTGTKPKSPWQLYRRGLIMVIVNPKVAMFFLAFFSQFVDPEIGPLILQFYQLGLLMIITTLITFGSIAFTAGIIGNWLRRSHTVQHWMNRVAATIFVALAVNLVTSEK